MFELRAWLTWNPSFDMIYLIFHMIWIVLKCILKNMIRNVLIYTMTWIWFLNQKRGLFVLINIEYKYLMERVEWFDKDFRTTTLLLKEWESLHSLDLCCRNLKSLILFACLGGLNWVFDERIRHDALWLRNRTCKSWCGDTNSDNAMLIQNRIECMFEIRFSDFETRIVHVSEQTKIWHKENLGPRRRHEFKQLIAQNRDLPIQVYYYTLA